jgi:putative transposase
LNVEVFFALADVRDKLEHWRQDYNLVRTHSALRDNPPAWFAAHWQNTAARAPARRQKPSSNVLLEYLN